MQIVLPIAPPQSTMPPLDSATADKQAVFRVADLPDTIRKDIYELVLCSWAPAPVASSVSLELLGGFCPESALTLLESPCVAILSVSRGIYREAMEVMCKKNSFIKVEARLPFEEMCKLLVPHQLPIQLLTKSASRNFRDAVLVHKVARKDNKKELHGQDFIFLSRDIKCLLRCWGMLGMPTISLIVERSLLIAGSYSVTNYDMSISHSINFRGVEQSDCMRESAFDDALQERLFSVYMTLRNLYKVTIIGSPANVTH
jgi:hypothetical protein